MELDRSNPSLDETLAALADARRRAVLQFLDAQADGVASVAELVRHLDAQQRATGREQAAAPERVEAELHHTHLPKLADHGLVEYDLQSGRVTYQPDETTERLLRFVRDL